MPINKLCVCGRIHVATERCKCKVEADRERSRKRRELLKEIKKLEKEKPEREYNL